MHLFRRAALVAPLVALAVATSACTGSAPTPGGQGSGGPGASPTATASTVPPTVSPSPPPSSVSEALAKYRLIDAVGRPFFCDPDSYPVARADETQLAVSRFPSIRADALTFDAIAARLGLDRNGTFDQSAQVAVYRQWKLLRAIVLTPTSSGWSFDVAVAGTSTPDRGERITGTVAGDGSVHVTGRQPSGILTCPICLARGTAIATPDGPVPVESLRLGDPVWTFDEAGRRIPGLVVALGSTPVPASHRVVRLRLADGRVLEASPGHPLLDGRPLGALRPGDDVDGAAVVSAELVAYGGGATYDLLASGPTGGYLADGIPLLSTIGR
jgi:Hint domain